MTATERLERGRESFRLHAWRDACEHLRASDRGSPLDPADLERLATAAYLIGEDAECVDVLTRAHQEFLSCGDAEGAARCAFWLGFALVHRGAHAPGTGWFARAGRLLDEGQRDSVIRGYLLVPAAIQRFVAGDPAEGLALFGQAGGIAEQFGDRNLAALTRHGRGRALIRLGRTLEGAALLDEAMVAVMAGDVAPILAGDIYCSVLEACQEIFDLRRAREWTTSLTEWCAAQPDLVPYRGDCLVYRAEILQRHGAWPDALAEAHEASVRLASPPGQGALGAAFYRIGELHRLRGEFAKADDAYRQAGLARRKVQPGLSLLRLAEGDVKAAVAAMPAALDEVKDPRTRAAVLEACVEVMLANDDRDAAREAANELADIARAIGAPFLTAASAHATGLVLLAEGDARAALAALRTAERTWRDLDTPYEDARTRALIARAAGELGDHDTARLELDAARDLFKRLGAAPDLARLATHATPGPAAAAGLSGRELQVLRLIATGKTNRAIADELYISEKTVARHVSNIFNKLGLSSRAAATAYAYQHRIV